MAAASRGGKARTRRKDVTNWAQTKNGSLNQDKPGARSWTIVTTKLMDPKRDEVIRNIIPISHIV
tara:strand:+ start:616 stop:810 length:195 start_codon:yes stop_codon:yes gene_type:complete